MNIIAIDLGKFNLMICFYETTTREHRFAKATTEKGYFRSVFENHQADLVVIEACGPSGWVNDLCAELKIPTIVCSTHEDAWLFKNVKRKTDKDDAFKLARLASLNQLTPTHVPSTEMRERRQLIKYRKSIVNRINRIKNTIRAIFANKGTQISSASKTWSRARRFNHGLRVACGLAKKKPVSRSTHREILSTAFRMASAAQGFLKATTSSNSTMAVLKSSSMFPLIKIAGVVTDLSRRQRTSSIPFFPGSLKSTSRQP